MSGLRATLIAGAIALVLGLLLLGQCQRARTAGAEAALGEKTNAAAASAAKDAVGAVEAVSGRNTASDQITRENEHAILEAPGADQLVDPAVSGAGLVGLCRRAAYRGDPKCMRFTPSGSVARASTGGGAAD